MASKLAQNYTRSRCIADSAISRPRLGVIQLRKHKMTEVSQDKEDKSESPLGAIWNLGLALGFLAIFILVFSSGYISGFLATALVLLGFRVIPVPGIAFSRDKSAEFPLNLSWWARALISVPWLISVAFLVAGRPSNWPDFQIIPKILLAVVVMYVGLLITTFAVVQTGFFLEKRLSRDSYEAVKFGFWAFVLGSIFLFVLFNR